MSPHNMRSSRRFADPKHLDKTEIPLSIMKTQLEPIYQ